MISQFDIKLVNERRLDVSASLDVEGVKALRELLAKYQTVMEQMINWRPERPEQ